MIQAHSAPTRGLPSVKAAVLAAAVEAAIALCRSVVTRWRLRREYRQLLELDDRLLADLGIERTQARSAAAEAHWYYSRLN